MMATIILKEKISENRDAGRNKAHYSVFFVSE